REQGDVGTLDGDVGSRPDSDAEVGLHEGRRVVDAVADHGHGAAVALEAADHGDLVGGEHFGEDRRDADLAGDRLGGGLVVAGDHDDVDAHGAQVGDRGGGGGLEGGGHGQHPSGRPVPSGEEGAVPPPFQPPAPL